ncbi:hypothetical protein [Myxococcus landrumensis]|uniref:Uncharacterized protein n=1 Tax=Myxococcus landrumensis TaxID=2813577 RepID=A0ABX7N259_9BACT|nr:hypothetical protein [Myxococcus landrumus]QSQ12810.1 hypothetical protein JY572_31350 [Myxococcus landrumus]
MDDQTRGRGGAVPMELASTARTRFDEFLRRQLGISDARDPLQVVGALRKLYPSTASRLDEEAKGLSIRFNEAPLPSATSVTGSGETPGMAQYRRLRSALEADLTLLAEHPSNREFKGALIGWRDATLAELAEGLDSAEQAADPSRRDRAFYSVRKLGNYAYVARKVGLLNPDLSMEYRRLAATLDAAAMVLRVRVGEGLYQAGFAEGGTVFEVALADLRQRREALIASLERLTGAISGDSEDWGDGEASYGTLLDELSQQGHHDLRAMLNPVSMARQLDLLLNNVASQAPESIQEIAATAPVELVHLKQLREVAAGVVAGSEGSTRAASAPLSAFVQKLNLFIEAFARPGAAARMLDLSLPFPFATPQLSRVDTEGRSAVRELISRRAECAAELDALFADPDFDPLNGVHAVQLDRLLFDIERATDLYLMGTGTSSRPGDEERRASLYASVLLRWAESRRDNLSSTPDSRLAAHLFALAALLKIKSPGMPPTEAEAHQFRVEQRNMELEWNQLALQFSRTGANRIELLQRPTELYTEPGIPAQTPDLSLATQVPPPLRVSVDRIADVMEDVFEDPTAAKSLRGKTPPGGAPTARPSTLNATPTVAPTSRRPRNGQRKQSKPRGTAPVRGKPRTPKSKTDESGQVH